MPIIASDLAYYKSSQASSDGGTISATAITDNVLNNLFDDVTASEAEIGATEYRKFFIKNNHATITWQDIVYWRTADSTSSDDAISLGVGSSADTDGSSELSAFTSNAVGAVVANAADTRQVTLVGEDADGARVTETLTLNGTTEVVGVQTFSKLYTAYVSSTNSNIVTIKQGSGGTSRGTIGASKYSAIYYQAPSSKAAGFEIGDLAASASMGLWLKRVVSPGAAAYTSNSATIKCEGETT